MRLSFFSAQQSSATITVGKNNSPCLYPCFLQGLDPDSFYLISMSLSSPSDLARSIATVAPGAVSV